MYLTVSGDIYTSATRAAFMVNAPTIEVAVMHGTSAGLALTMLAAKSKTGEVVF